MSKGATEITKDRPNLTDTILDKINQGIKKTQSLFCCPCICRVPKHLREPNESPYIPRLISIGPLHRDLQTPMQHIKKYYTGNLAFRAAKGKDEMENKRKQIEVLAKCVDKMKECIDKAKQHYAEEVEVGDDEMAEMMLVDGCFILELLYASHERSLNKKSKAARKETANKGDSGNKPNGGDYSSTSRVDEQSFKDPIFETLSTDTIVKQDLLLLENQIPFFVLEELFKLTVAEIPGELSLTDYVKWYFKDIMSPERENSGSERKTSCCSPSHCVVCICGSEKENEQEEKEPGKASDYYHILHLLHDLYLPNSIGAPRASLGPCPIALPWHNPRSGKTEKKDFSELEVRASDLDYAGVKFVPGDGEGNNLFDVKFNENKCVSWWFHRATFEIPVLHIDDLTEPFLRNVIALEQCCPGVLCHCHFTSYATFMDMLIDSDKDVRVLQKVKVIRNYLGSDEEVSVLFNNLCKNVVIEKFHFDDQCQDAYKYSKYRWPKIMAYWNRTYFASPWAFRGFILGLIIFGIQVTTFIRSFLK